MGHTRESLAPDQTWPVSLLVVVGTRASKQDLCRDQTTIKGNLSLAEVCLCHLAMAEAGNDMRPQDHRACKFAQPDDTRRLRLWRSCCDERTAS